MLRTLHISFAAAKSKVPGGMVQTDVTDSKAGACCHGRSLSTEVLSELAGLGADWLWETDGHNRFTWLSESFGKLSGIDPKPFLGHSRMPFIKSVPFANANPRSHLEALEAHEPFRDFIYELRGASPECRWISISGLPQFDSEGKFRGYLGTGRNVTHFVTAMNERDNAERQNPSPGWDAKVHGEASREGRNEERLLAALDEIQDAFCYYDGDDRLVVHNKAMLTMYAGLEDVIAPGMTFSDLIDAGLDRGIWLTHDLSKQEWRNKFFERRAAAPKTEAVIAFADGRWIMHRERRTEDGGTIGICTDITAIKRHEADLAGARDEAERVLSDQKKTIDMMEMGVVVLDSDLNAEIINSAFYTIWKISPDDVSVGSPFRALIDINRHNDIYGVADDKWEEYIDVRLSEIRGGDVQPREFTRADGCTMIYSVTTLSGGRRLVSYYDISEMKSREAELAGALEKAKLAEAVINSVPNPIFVFDADLNFVLANEAYAKVYGRTPDDLVGHKSGDFSSPEDAARFAEIDREVLETGEPYETEEDFEVKGIGRTRIVRKQRVRMESGNDYVACSVFDVSEMKRRELDAQEARQRLVDVLEVLPAGVVIYDRDDRFVLANRYNHKALPAMSHTMQPGRPLRDAIEAAHDAGYFRDSGDAELDSLYDVDRNAWIEGYLARYQAHSRGFERKNPDGRWIKAFDTRTDDGTYVGVRVDITELKEREAALNQSMRDNEVFQNLIDNVPVAIYAKRPDLKLMYVNKGWCKLTGHTKEEAIGKTDADIFGNEGKAFMESDRTVLRLRQTREIDETITAPDGTQRYQIARKGTMIAEDGSLYIIGSTTDVTDIRRREEELRDARERAVLADRAKSEFLANMSHEIRTPMNGVLGMAELLAKSELTSKQKTFTDIIVKSGNALLTIINDILDFSKIDAGQLVLDPAPFNLAEAIEDVATLVSTRAKEKDLELIASVMPALPDVFVGDVGRIRQIITNLLGNGVKFTEKGHVLIEVSGDVGDKETKLHFKVTDTGIGIPEDQLAAIFDKFSQVDASSTRRHEGTGLGLAITARLIELMGGEMGVTSEEGRGSSFWFDITLPNASRPGLRSPAPVDVSGARVHGADDPRGARAGAPARRRTGHGRIGRRGRSRRLRRPVAGHRRRA